MKEIDVRGKPCPHPVLVAKEACKSGTPFRILCDGSGQPENIQRAVKRAGASSKIISHDGYESVEVVPSLAVPQTTSSEKLVVSVPGDRFGTGGDRELEDVLCRMYFHTLTEMDEAVPDTLVFYDRGVFLTTDDSPVLEDLKILEKKGLTLLVCGTCLKHFEITDKHSAGTISNMYEIARELGTAVKHYAI